MLEHLEAGLSAAEAARLTRQEFAPAASPDVEPRPAAATGLTATVPPTSDSSTSGPTITDPTATVPPTHVSIGDPRDLGRALDRLDEDEANRIFDRLLGALSLAAVIRDAVLPYLRELGERWREQGEAAIAQEHFATGVLRGRLLGLARGWGGGHGPGALLACFPGDHHDLGLICFGLALREKGWRITFLGANTPLATIESVAMELAPELTVLTRAVPSDDDPAVEATLKRIAATTSLALAGHGVGERLAHMKWARFLVGDPFTAAHHVAASFGTGAAGGFGPAGGALGSANA
jgi:hypothetical protein